MLIDTHAHLVSLDDYRGALTNARDNGVFRIISMSTDLSSCRSTLDIATEYDFVYAACGIHPHAASTYSDEVLTEIGNFCGNEKVVAIGETGLDYHYLNSPRDVQIESFEAHIELAKNLELPFVVHVREADDDMISILRSSGLGDNPGVIHCFSGDFDTARKYLDLGFFISFSGIVTFNRAEEVREAARKVPFDRILVETDSPYLAPVPVRGKKNEPANVRYIADTVAKVRKVDLVTLERQLEANTRKLFSNMS